MKNIIKSNFKLFVGVLVLIFAFGMFFIIQGSGNLEKSNMRNWRSANTERRMAAVKILTGDDEVSADLMIECMNKVSEFPNASEMSVRDCASLCYTGIQLKQNI